MKRKAREKKKQFVKFDSLSTRNCALAQTLYIPILTLFFFSNHRNQINHVHFRFHWFVCVCCFSIFSYFQSIDGFVCSIDIVLVHTMFMRHENKNEKRIHTKAMLEITKCTSKSANEKITSNLMKMHVSQKTNDARAFSNISSRLIFSIIILQKKKRKGEKDRERESVCGKIIVKILSTQKIQW